MRTIREQKRGKLTLRLLDEGQGFAGIVIGSDAKPPIILRGSAPDEVWGMLEEEAAKSDRAYFGFDGAKARFLRLFPEGFAASAYLNMERKNKDKARKILLAGAPLERALEGTHEPSAVFRAYARTNLLAPIEKAKLGPVLNGPNGQAVVQAIARFASQPTDAGLHGIEHPLKPHDCAKWTVVTYLPFLWLDEQHMFLKPEMMREFALRVGHKFKDAYEPALRMPVYRSLLDLAGITKVKVADLGPRDNIDIQSFMWVVGKYDAGSVEPNAGAMEPPTGNREPGNPASTEARPSKPNRFVVDDDDLDYMTLDT